MKIKFFSILIVFSLFVTNLTFGSEGKKMDELKALDKKQQSIISIAAFTASGDIKHLKPVLNQGLDSKLTINEISEVIVHLYAYTGFPRSLNALNTFREVVEERKSKGIEDAMGREASPVPANLNKDEYGASVRAKLAGLEKDISGAWFQLFAPAMDTFLKEHLFADLFVRDVISHQERELATIGALANMSGTQGQLYFHLGAAMNTGLSDDQMEDFISVLKLLVDTTVSENARNVLTAVLNSRK